MGTVLIYMWLQKQRRSIRLHLLGAFNRFVHTEIKMHSSNSSNSSSSSNSGSSSSSRRRCLSREHVLVGKQFPCLQHPGRIRPTDKTQKGQQHGTAKRAIEVILLTILKEWNP